MSQIRLSVYVAAFLFIGWASPISATRAAEDAGLQTALLYEDPADAPGNPNAAAQPISGWVTWRFLESSAEGPSVEADLQIPSRKLKVKLTIHKNVDGSLPASHLIEVEIENAFAPNGKRIGDVRGIAMKSTEPAAGTRLAGVAAKVSDDLFWIALSAAPADLSTNLALLRERDWIDMPFVYEDGKRAIFTLEKGAAGDRVFREALAAWEGTSETPAAPPSPATVDQLRPTIAVPRPAQ
jgi:hypothetical protein